MEKPKVKRIFSLRIGWIRDLPVTEVLCRFTNISVKTVAGLSKRSFLATIQRQIVLTVTAQMWKNNSPCLPSQDLLPVMYRNKAAGAAALRNPACAVWGPTPKFKFGDRGTRGQPPRPPSKIHRDLHEGL